MIVYAIHRVSPGPVWRDVFMLERYVVRSGRVRRDLGFHVVRPTLKLAREHVPAGYNRFPPMPGDEPTLVETWV